MLQEVYILYTVLLKISTQIFYRFTIISPSMDSRIKCTNMQQETNNKETRICKGNRKCSTFRPFHFTELGALLSLFERQGRGEMSDMIYCYDCRHFQVCGWKTSKPSVLPRFTKSETINKWRKKNTFFIWVFISVLSFETIHYTIQNNTTIHYILQKSQNFTFWQSKLYIMYQIVLIRFFKSTVNFCERHSSVLWVFVHNIFNNP